jgi:precorrin-3B methylase
MSSKKGKLYVVGLGPGSHDHMTYRAKQVIEESEVIIGYDTYVSLVEDLIAGKDRFSCFVRRSGHLWHGWAHI